MQYPVQTPVSGRYFQRSALALAIMAAVPFSIFGSAVHAEESTSAESDAPELEMVVVVGQATGGLDEVITREQLDNLQAQDLADVFRVTPLVSVGGSVGMGQKIYVRNTGEDMLNISVDGAEQAGAVFHHSGRISV